jgi:hypothetical protein
MYDRLQEFDPDVHRRVQAQRTTAHIRRLPPVRHDVRELPQDAGLQHRGGAARETGHGDSGGAGRVSSVIGVGLGGG